MTEKTNKTGAYDEMSGFIMTEVHIASVYDFASDEWHIFASARSDTHLKKQVQLFLRELAEELYNKYSEWYGQNDSVYKEEQNLLWKELETFIDDVSIKRKKVKLSVPVMKDYLEGE